MRKKGNESTVNKHKTRYFTAVITAVVIVVSFFCGFFSYRLFLGKKLNSVNWAVKMIESHGCYYDEESGEVKEFSEEDYIKMITSSLDRYSAFFTKEEYSAEILTGKGNNFGIGITFFYDDVKDKYGVLRVVWNSPAEKAGFCESDIFVSGSVGGKTVVFDDENTPMTFITGLKEGEEATFTVEREGKNKDITVKKSVYIANYVKYVDSENSLFFSSTGTDELQKAVDDNGNALLDGKTAMISLYLFEGNAVEGIETAMSYMKERGRTKLILDLRNNGGGFMDMLQEIASYMISVDGQKKPIIAIAKDKDGDEEEFTSSGNNFNEGIEKIVVLANENTASASECLIGAMLYYGCRFSKDNLVIEKHTDSVGEVKATTYGKGIMQTTYKNFFSGEAIKLTTATIFWPDGKTTIHGKGLTTTEINSVDRGKAFSRALEILS